METLLEYDGVFLAGMPADNEVLIDYVNRGGNVYLAGGTRRSKYPRDAETWATFLSAFSLAYEYSPNRIEGTLPLETTTHPIFNQVEQLYQRNGNSIRNLNPNNGHSFIIGRGENGSGLYAVYNGGSILP